MMLSNGGSHPIADEFSGYSVNDPPQGSLSRHLFSVRAGSLCWLTSIFFMIIVRLIFSSIIFSSRWFLPPLRRARDLAMVTSNKLLEVSNLYQFFYLVLKSYAFFCEMVEVTLISKLFHNINISKGGNLPMSWNQFDILGFFQNMSYVCIKGSVMRKTRSSSFLGLVVFLLFFPIFFHHIISDLTVVFDDSFTTSVSCQE